MGLRSRLAHCSATGVALMGLTVVPAQAAEAVVSVAAPAVTGEATYRETLTASPGTWTPPVGLTYAYQWLRDGVPVPGATSTELRLGLDDVGHAFAVTVTATDAAGAQAAATSAPTPAVGKAAFEMREQPRVVGVPRFTRVLSAERPSVRPRPTSVRLRWLRDGEPVSRARGRTYRVGVVDVGRELRLRVTVRREGFVTQRLLSRPREALHLVPVRRMVTYHVETRGPITADLAEFRRQAQETLADPRGWRSAGVEFRPVPRGGDVTIVLAAAATVPGFSPVCSAMWSCRVGRYVVINQDRWLRASPAWNAAGRARRDYRHLVVNHEMGHWLGHGHLGCPGPGPAPVMMQQSKGRGACSFNPWPLPSERWFRR